MREHLATCPEAHDEFAELGGVLPALADSVPLMEPPAALGPTQPGRGCSQISAARDPVAAVPGVNAQPPQPSRFRWSPRDPPLRAPRVDAASTWLLASPLSWPSASWRLEPDPPGPARPGAGVRAGGRPCSTRQRARCAHGRPDAAIGPGPPRPGGRQPDGRMRLAMQDLPPTTGRRSTRRGSSPVTAPRLPRSVASRWALMAGLSTRDGRRRSGGRTGPDPEPRSG